MLMSPQLVTVVLVVTILLVKLTTGVTQANKKSLLHLFPLFVHNCHRPNISANQEIDLTKLKKKTTVKLIIK